MRFARLLLLAMSLMVAGCGEDPARERAEKACYEAGYSDDPKFEPDPSDPNNPYREEYGDGKAAFLDCVESKLNDQSDYGYSQDAGALADTIFDKCRYEADRRACVDSAYELAARSLTPADRTDLCVAIALKTDGNPSVCE